MVAQILHLFIHSINRSLLGSEEFTEIADSKWDTESEERQRERGDTQLKLHFNQLNLQSS